MGRDYVAEEIDHGTRTVAGVEVRVEEERWRYGGSSFSVYRVSDGLDLTQAVHGQCLDNPPTDDEIADLLTAYADGYRDPGSRPQRPGEAYVRQAMTFVSAEEDARWLRKVDGN